MVGQESSGCPLRWLQVSACDGQPHQSGWVAAAAGPASESLEVLNPVAAPVKSHFTTLKQAFDDLYCFFELAYPRGCGLEGQSGLLVINRVPAGTNTQLEAAAGQDVDRRRFFGRRRWMAKVIVQDERANPDQGRG